jgi:hypothetical protein
VEDGHPFLKEPSDDSKLDVFRFVIFMVPTAFIFKVKLKKNNCLARVCERTVPTPPLVGEVTAECCA